MGMDKLKGFFSGTNDDIKENNIKVNEEEFYEMTSTFADKSGTSKMVLFEPRAYSESQQIADYLKKRNAVVAVAQANRKRKSGSNICIWI